MVEGVVKPPGNAATSSNVECGRRRARVVTACHPRGVDILDGRVVRRLANSSGTAVELVPDV